MRFAAIGESVSLFYIFSQFLFIDLTHQQQTGKVMQDANSWILDFYEFSQTLDYYKFSQTPDFYKFSQTLDYCIQSASRWKESEFTCDNKIQTIWREIKL